MDSPEPPEIQLNYEKAIAGLGKICVEFQRLETCLKAATGLLLDPTDFQVVTIVTAQLSFGAIIDLLYSLYRYRFQSQLEDKELEKLNEYLGKCLKLASRRNQIIHSHWKPDLEEGNGALGTKHMAKKGKGLQSQKETVSESDLEELAKGFQDLRETYLRDWAERVHRYDNWRALEESVRRQPI